MSKLRLYWYTGWFKYDRDDLRVNKSQFVPVIFEPPCISRGQNFFVKVILISAVPRYLGSSCKLVQSHLDMTPSVPVLNGGSTQLCPVQMHNKLHAIRIRAPDYHCAYRRVARKDTNNRDVKIPSLRNSFSILQVSREITGSKLISKIYCPDSRRQPIPPSECQIRGQCISTWNSRAKMFSNNLTLFSTVHF
jgi:hypothetical protein